MANAVREEVTEGKLPPNMVRYQSVFLNFYPFNFSREDTKNGEINCTKWAIIKMNEYCKLDLQSNIIHSPLLILFYILQHPNAIGFNSPQIKGSLLDNLKSVVNKSKATISDNMEEKTESTGCRLM